MLGLSGGIDSALVACLAADALGPERVNVAIMPSPTRPRRPSPMPVRWPPRWACAPTSLRSSPRWTPTSTLSRPTSTAPADLTEENLQARIRGNLLMALSNKFGWLVLTTGNKSEMSVGYTTLYGDLAGGFAVIKDVPKTLVYRLCEYRNSPEGSTSVDGRTVPSPIPTSIIERAPSAELAPTSATRTRCRPMRCSTASCTATSSSTGARAAARRGTARRRSIARSASSTSPSTSAVRRPPASRSLRARSAVTGACR